MTLEQALKHTPVELLSYIFEELSLTELDNLERACTDPYLIGVVNECFHRRVVHWAGNPLLELCHIGRAHEVEYIASQRAVDVDVNVSSGKGQTPLHIAAKAGFAHVVRALFLFPDLVVDKKDHAGSSALALASQSGHFDVVELLLSNGADVDTETLRGETALSKAARHGHKDVVALLLSANASLLHTDDEGWTGLDWAIVWGRNDVVELLLRHPNQIQGPSTHQQRAFLLAAESGNDLAAELLLNSGVEVDCKDDQQSTPLHWAVSGGHQSTVEMLLRWGADPSSKDKYGNTPLHWAVGYPAIMAVLLSKGANVDAQNGNGKTSLLWSVLAQSSQCTQLLLEIGGADICLADEHGFTALHAAASKGDWEAPTALLDRGADAGAKDVDGWTATDVAVVNDHEKVAIALGACLKNESAAVAYGLDDDGPQKLQNENTRHLLREMTLRKATGSDGVTGLRAAVNGKHTHLRLTAMLEAGASIDEVDPVGGTTALTLATWFNEIETVRLLLDHGAAVGARDSVGRTALHIAAEGGYCDLLALLVGRGANVDALFCSWTPLLLAVRRSGWGDEASHWMVEHLSSRLVGANLETRDYFGRGMLHWCAVHGETRTLKMLLRRATRGTPLEPPLGRLDHCGQSPLQLAVAASRKDAVRVLLGRNTGQSDLMRRSGDGVTVVHVAAYTGRLDILTLLHDACERANNQDEAPQGHLVKVRLDLKAKDVDGYTALTVALLAGNLHVAQFLRRLPGGSDGDIENLWRATYADLAVRQPPLLDLPEVGEFIDLDGVRDGTSPQKPVFSRAVRQWLHDQHNRYSRTDQAQLGKASQRLNL